MNERRRRESTVVESGFGSAPAPQPTQVEHGYSGNGNFQQPENSPFAQGFGAPSSPAQGGGWSSPGPQSAPARRRDATVVDEPTARPSEPAGTAPASNVTSTRRIAGWLLSEDALQSHTLRAGTNLVGRGSDNDIIVENPLVSGLQCNIICEEDQTLLMPRPEARNATSIDDRRVYQTSEIPEGATISFAGSVFTYISAPWRRRDSE